MDAPCNSTRPNFLQDAAVDRRDNFIQIFPPERDRPMSDELSSRDVRAVIYTQADDDGYREVPSAPRNGNAASLNLWPVGRQGAARSPLDRNHQLKTGDETKTASRPMINDVVVVVWQGKNDFPFFRTDNIKPSPDRPDARHQS
jgi:hypothetical protein